ncbi:MAG: 16S rRNA (guanine(527)-N(7))-methyltransferase RsmG [Candidatus Polarisedimenticolaceae bacterium]|nr:16S rRNA (guanine(527)-N(7))-methyltransferase RsmG [Candidatus Polarisedimenticolaceae bacterium]
MREAELSQALASGIAELNLQITAEQQETLLTYIALLNRWNKRFNLTAVRDPAEMIPRHLLDSLSVSDYLQGKRVLDVGTGAGLPGIPLAILLPDIQFTLLDSNGKKTRFVRQAVMELGLKNVQVEQMRVEAYRPTQKFDTVITRAFAALSEILSLTSHLLAPTGQLLAMKGRQTQDELEVADLAGRSVEVIQLQVPQLEGERCVVLINRKVE